MTTDGHYHITHHGGSSEETWFTTPGNTANRRIFTMQVTGYFELASPRPPPRGDEEISACVAKALIDALYRDLDSWFEHYLSVHTSGGVVKITGVTKTKAVHEGFVACIKRIEADVPGVKSVDVTDVIHATGPKPVLEVPRWSSDEVLMDFEVVAPYVSALQRLIKNTTMHDWVLHVDAIGRTVRVRGRVEFCDEHAAFLSMVRMFQRGNSDVKVDTSGVTTSNLTTSTIKPNK